ncbi:hypothetical protein Tco_0850280 [Tanacetum coccineum]
MMQERCAKQGATTLRNYSSGYWKDLPQAVTKQDLGVNIISAKENAAAEATRILELSDQHLILQHLGWVWLLFEYVYVEVGTWVGLAGKDQIADINQLLDVHVS